MPAPTGSPETPEPAQRAGSGRSGGRRDRTQHDRRHGEDVVSDEPDSQGETLARARGDSRGQRRVRFGQVSGFVGCNSFANVMRGLLLAATAMLVLSMPATEVKAQTVGICSRALAVQNAILDVTGRPTCSDVTAADLASVTTLTVRSYTPTSIDPADFAGLTGLISLQIDASPQLTTVPDNAFAGLTALTSLSFQDLSDLTTLAEDAFDGLTALATLNLQFTGLTTLHADIFDGLTALATLDLSFLFTLTALDEDIFDGLTALKTLNLAFSNQTALHADIFDGLTALDNLTLSNNGLTTLDADIFDGLTALRILALNSNSLTTLDADIFDGLTALEELEQLDGGNDWPTGLWSDGENLWLLENGQGADDAVYAYDRASGERAAERVQRHRSARDRARRLGRGPFDSEELVLWNAGRRMGASHTVGRYGTFRHRGRRMRSPQRSRPPLRGVAAVALRSRARTAAVP